MLTETQKVKLDGIVQAMIRKGESDKMIRFVIQDFKNVKDQENISREPITAPPDEGGSTGLTMGPLSLLAVPGQVAAKVVSDAIISPYTKRIQKNRESLNEIASRFIEKAKTETDPSVKEKLLSQARDAMQSAQRSGALVQGLEEEVLKRQKIETPIGTIPALSDTTSEAIQQISGRGVSTVALTGGAVIGPTGAGALLGLGAGLEERLTAEDILERSAFYAVGGKILGFGFGKIAGTATGQRILMSPAAQLLGKVTSPFLAKNAEGGIGLSVDKAFRYFGNLSERLLSPGTYTKPLWQIVRPVGEATGVLRTQEQRVANAEKKITQYWENTKQRYVKLVRFDENSPAVLGREGIVPTGGPGGAMLTSEQAHIVQGKALAEKHLLRELLTKSGGFVSEQEVRDAMIRSITKGMSGTERKQALVYLKREIDALLADEVKSIVVLNDGTRLIPNITADAMKSFLWSRGYASKLAPLPERTTAEAARLMGNAMKTAIENSVRNLHGDIGAEAIIKLNAHIGELLQAERFLEALNGSKLPFGLIGRHFARTVGAIIGMKGGPLGSLAGAITADELVTLYQNPATTVGRFAEIMAQARKVAPEAVREAERILSSMVQLQESRYALPPPSSIPMGPKTPPPSVGRVVPAPPGQIGRQPKGKVIEGKKVGGQAFKTFKSTEQ